MQPKNSSLTTLSNEALCKLRDEIAVMLNSRAENLLKEVDLLTGGGGRKGIGRDIRKKAAPKYRGPNGETWTGRGMNPRWLTSALNEGKQLEDFLIAARNEGLENKRSDQTRTRKEEMVHGRRTKSAKAGRRLRTPHLGGVSPPVQPMG
jgi:DNA-binding protein H-NS